MPSNKLPVDREALKFGRDAVMTALAERQVRGGLCSSQGSADLHVSAALFRTGVAWSESAHIWVWVRVLRETFIWKRV